MNKYFKQNFNLIEIALAMCIIAIGLSGVMSLFALGAKSSRLAVSNNNSSIIAEYIISNIKNMVLAKATYNDLIPQGSILENIPNNYNETTINGITVDNTVSPGTKWETINSEDAQNKDKAFMLRHKDNKNVFLFRQLSSSTDATDVKTDFSCIAYLWLDKIPHPTIADSDIDKKYAIALCIEISSPAEMPYEAREKYNYRIEIFNTKHEIQPTGQ